MLAAATAHDVCFRDTLENASMMRLQATAPRTEYSSLPASLVLVGAFQYRESLADGA
jgi:hypothetical protein